LIAALTAHLQLSSHRIFTLMRGLRRDGGTISVNVFMSAI
jgi:hypothetical protein